MSARFGPGGNCEDFYAAGNDSSLQVFQWINEHGLDLYEYQGGNGLKIPVATLRSFAEQAEKNNVTVSLHAPYYIAISSEDKEKRQNSVNYILQSLRFAKNLGAGKIVIHSGGAGKSTRAEAMERAKKTLDESANAAYEKKLDGVKIGIETMGKENQLGTPEEVAELCKRDKIYIPVVDFGHLYTRSLGKDMRCADDFARIFEFIDKELGYDILHNLHCHFSKIEYTAKGEKKHLKFSSDDYGPDYVPFIEAVIKAGISPDVICESAGTMTEDSKTMKKYYTEANKK